MMALLSHGFWVTANQSRVLPTHPLYPDRCVLFLLTPPQSIHPQGVNTHSLIWWDCKWLQSWLKVVLVLWDYVHLNLVYGRCWSNIIDDERSFEWTSLFIQQRHFHFQGCVESMPRQVKDFSRGLWWPKHFANTLYIALYWICHQFLAYRSIWMKAQILMFTEFPAKSYHLWVMLDFNNKFLL